LTEEEERKQRKKLEAVREIPNIAGLCDACRLGIQEVIDKILDGK